MSPRFWIAVTIAAVASASCGSGSPSAPSSPDAGGTTSGTALTGTIVSAIDGQPLSGVTVRIGSQRAVSSSSGTFSFDNLPSGTQAEVLSAASVVERHTSVVIPSPSPKREALIPADFDLAAFDEMFRSNQRLERWTTPPALVVLTTVMKFELGLGGGGDDEYRATPEQLTDEEADLLVSQLTTALRVLTGNTFSEFASVERESAASGAEVKTSRSGKIVVGRYKGVQGLLNTVGFGSWATDDTGRVMAGAVYLDSDFDRNSETQRRLLRTHELGHALGYNHVTSRTSVMNPAIGPDVQTFDQQGCIIAFQRLPGSQSPDSDPTTPSARSGARSFTVAPSTWHKVVP